MAPLITCEVSDSVWRALGDEVEKTGDSLSRVVDRALAASFELDRHSMFQVSTSSALVRGVFRSAVTVADLKRHGDFGLGTFEGLDGELVMLDGVCYRAGGGGGVTIPNDRIGTPFALVTRFGTDLAESAGVIEHIDDLKTRLDDFRPSQNLFAAFRIDGRFSRLDMRAACRAAPGEGLEEATRHQSEFEATDVGGTLVGFWSPEYATAVSVPGYHFHFISGDRSIGGHVLDLAADRLDVRVHVESDLHVALPETTEFLEADLTGDHRGALDRAETRSRQSAPTPEP